MPLGAVIFFKVPNEKIRKISSQLFDKVKYADQFFLGFELLHCN